MVNLIYSVITYLIIILFYFIYLRLYRKKKPYNKMEEVEFLKRKYKFNKRKWNNKKLTWICVNINAFIIAMTAVICFLIPLTFILQLVIGFVIILILIFLLYMILIKIILKGKKSEKNDKYKKD